MENCKIEWRDEASIEGLVGIVGGLPVVGASQCNLSGLGKGGWQYTRESIVLPM